MINASWREKKQPITSVIKDKVVMTRSEGVFKLYTHRLSLPLFIAPLEFALFIEAGLLAHAPCSLFIYVSFVLLLDSEVPRKGRVQKCLSTYTSS